MVCTAEWKFSDEVVKIADDFQMGTIMWTVDTIDWKRPEPDVLLQRVMRKIHPVLSY